MNALNSTRECWDNDVIFWLNRIIGQGLPNVSPTGFEGSTPGGNDAYHEEMNREFTNAALDDLMIHNHKAHLRRVGIGSRIWCGLFISKMFHPWFNECCLRKWFSMLLVVNAQSSMWRSMLQKIYGVQFKSAKWNNLSLSRISGAKTSRTGAFPTWMIFTKEICVKKRVFA